MASLTLPGLTSAHSHAFQRGMRGLAQRPQRSGDDDFWSWREAMYGLASSLTPESIFDISRVAFAELYAAGVRTVGEFHYVHHQADGTPYDDRTCLAQAVVKAARVEGLRIALLRTVYHRAGEGRPPQGAQKRFSDPTLDVALADVEALQTMHRDDDGVVIGLAVHSVRAVPPTWLDEIAAFASRQTAPFPVHMHLAEQPGEIEACLAETGRRPVELAADAGLITPQFVAVHATHLAPNEPALLHGAYACICPTTERDLGDGLPDIGALRREGVKLCVGVDSHVLTSPLEDIRGLELGERLRTLRRVTHRSDHDRTLAEQLWDEGSVIGAQACGFADAGPTITYDEDDPTLALVDADHRLDALIFGTTLKPR